MRFDLRPPGLHAVRGAIVLLILLVSCAIGGRVIASPPMPEDERIGRRLADAVIQSARAYAQAGRRDWIACDAAGGSGEGAGGAVAGAGAGGTEAVGAAAMQEICGAEQALASVMAQAAVLREEDRRAGREDLGTTEAAAFSWLIDQGLNSRQSIVRLHVLMRMFDLCDQGSFMSEEGKRHCPDFVEKGCIVTLRHDSNGLNRQVALEILGAGYASEASAAVLQDLAAKPARAAVQCRKVFTGETAPGGSQPGGPVSLDAVNKQYGNARSPCEHELSRGLLKALQDQRDQAGPAAH